MAGPGSLRKRLQPEMTELQHRALCRAAEASLAVDPDPVLQRALEEMRRAWDRAEVDHGPKLHGHQPMAIGFDERHVGTGVFHAVKVGADPHSTALCGYEPSRLNRGFTDLGPAVTCQVCLQCLRRMTTIQRQG